MIIPNFLYIVSLFLFNKLDKQLLFLSFSLGERLFLLNEFHMVFLDYLIYFSSRGTIIVFTMFYGFGPEFWNG